MAGESPTSNERRRSAKREQFAADLKWLMSDVRGRRLMAKLLSDTRMFASTYNPLSKDVATEMAFYEGQKNIGYRALADINAHCPDAYFLMMKERNG